MDGVLKVRFLLVSQKFKIMNLIDLVQLAADKIEMVANLILVTAAYQWWQSNKKITVTLSIGSFRIRKKDFDLPNLTAIVSQSFFNGAWLPDNIRKELLVLTTPKIEDLQVFTDLSEVGGGIPPVKK